MLFTVCGARSSSGPLSFWLLDRDRRERLRPTLGAKCTVASVLRRNHSQPSMREEADGDARPERRALQAR
jgi:hypothetical protein